MRAAGVLDQWLGGSESAIRLLFTRARASAPCILFFDEIDSLATNRSETSGISSDVFSRILSTLLNEMDGVSSADGRQGVLVVATTNRLHAIDAALLRPGRLEEHLFLDKPIPTDIVDILNIHLSRVSLNKDINLEEVSKVLYELGATGADIYGICNDACLQSIRFFDENADISSMTLMLEDINSSINIWKR